MFQAPACRHRPASQWDSRVAAFCPAYFRWRFGVTGDGGVDPSVERLQLVEEMVRVDKRTIETGRVRVRTVVDEEPVVVSATLI
ncbi:MAG: DUF2382 domain-containing protein, partial [Janthinobacterium lividum]